MYFLCFLCICFGIFVFFILRSKIELHVISLNHTSSQVPLPRKRLILRGSCPRSRQGHESDIHLHNYSRFKSGAPTQQQTSLTSIAGPVYIFRFPFCVNVLTPLTLGWGISPQPHTKRRILRLW